MHHRDDFTFSFVPSKIIVKQLDKNKHKKVNSKKGLLLTSYIRNKTCWRKQGQGTSGGNNSSGVSRDAAGQSHLTPGTAAVPPVMSSGHSP
jgi:hypothetical protein